MFAPEKLPRKNSPWGSLNENSYGMSGHVKLCRCSKKTQLETPAAEQLPPPVLERYIERR